MRRWETGVPEGSPRISVDGVDLAVDDSGNGPSVICLHAIAHGSADFDTFAAIASRNYRVIRFDWPGQGRSAESVGEISPARYAMLVRGVVTHLGVENPIIIGCSIGGAAAIEYASRFDVRALVLANSGGLVAPSKAVNVACRLLSRFFAAGASGVWWFGPVYRMYYRMVLPTPAARAQRRRIVRAGYENAAVLAAAWSTFADSGKADQRRAAIALDVPVLFTWAMQDRINLFAASAPAIARMKKARVVKFNGGHAAFLEQPRQFMAEFDRFVAELAAIPAPSPVRPVEVVHA